MNCRRPFKKRDKPVYINERKWHKWCYACPLCKLTARGPMKLYKGQLCHEACLLWITCIDCGKSELNSNNFILIEGQYIHKVCFERHKCCYCKFSVVFVGEINIISRNDAFDTLTLAHKGCIPLPCVICSVLIYTKPKMVLGEFMMHSECYIGIGGRICAANIGMREPTNCRNAVIPLNGVLRNGLIPKNVRLAGQAWLIIARRIGVFPKDIIKMIYKMVIDISSRDMNGELSWVHLNIFNVNHVCSESKCCNRYTVCRFCDVKLSPYADGSCNQYHCINYAYKCCGCNSLIPHGNDPKYCTPHRCILEKCFCGKSIRPNPGDLSMCGFDRCNYFEFVCKCGSMVPHNSNPDWYCTKGRCLFYFFMVLLRAPNKKG
jgi:hypothetical protein